MTRSAESRSSSAWVADLAGQGERATRAGADLTRYLAAALRRIVGRTPRLSGLEVDDLAQDALVSILRSLHTFRGDSEFTTWATAVATRVAFTEMRRRRARQAHETSLEEAESAAAGRASAFEDALEHDDLLRDLKHAIDEVLTERQRVAVLAELRGIPTVEIAEHMGTNQNALYKLHHDARKKLRNALVARGHTSGEMHRLAGGGGTS